MAPLTLLDLPNELLMQLPKHMAGIEDFKNASSSCRRLRTIFADTLPKTILHLASRSAPTFFSPHPHFLVLSVARQVATWAVAVEAEREARIERLVEAFRGGVGGLLEFALRDDVEGVGLTMAGVRRMYEARFSTINPLNSTIDAMIGRQWYAQPNFWDGGAEDAFTLDADVDSATMQLLLYGELFGPTMESYLEPARKIPRLGIDERIEFVKYCIPDWADRPRGPRRDGFQTLPIGPYAPIGLYSKGADDSAWTLDGNQTALAHLVGGAMFRGVLWKRAWRRVLIAAGAEENSDGKWPASWVKKIQAINFKRKMSRESELEAGADAQPEDWRFTIFWHALTQVGGLQTMEMVAQFKGREEGREVCMKSEWKSRIVQLRDQALALKDEDEPGYKNFGKTRKLRISAAPDLGAELYWCCAGVWHPRGL